MLNTDSFHISPDLHPLTRDIELFGRTITAKAYSCASEEDDEVKERLPVKLLLTICPAAQCNASCAFCVAAGERSIAKLDTGKLRKALERLKEYDIILNASVSGGEPFSDIKLLNETVNTVYDVFGESFRLSINTNGSGIGRLSEIDGLEYLDALHISRHHYDDRINDRIFGTKMPGTAELKEAIDAVSFKDLFVFNCLTLKDGIGTPDEARRFLEYAHSLAVPKVGFITPMPVNEYTEQARVPYSAVLNNHDGRLLFTRGFRDCDLCHCRDGIYACDDGGLIQFYGRETCPGVCSYVRGLVYGADNVLRTGYGAGADILWDGE